MASFDELIDELAELCGIVPEYWDVFGARREAAPETKKSILHGMGLRTETPEDLQREIDLRRGRPWNLFIDPVKVILHTEQPLIITVHIPVREADLQTITFKCILEDEDGGTDNFSFSHDDVEIAEQKTIDGIHHLRVNIRLDVIKDIGYYELNLFYLSSGFGQTGTSRIIITPEACFIPPGLAATSAGGVHPERSRTWGLCINLYGLRSDNNWGVGDFTDLRKVTEWTSDLGGGFVGINPLHAIPNRMPSGISPYSPITRLYKNFIYLDAASMRDVSESSAALDLMDIEDYRTSIQFLRDARFVDYEQAAAVKRDILQLAFDSFYETHLIKASPRGDDFRAFILREGKLLEDFALFTALQEATGIQSWRGWPAEYRDILSPEVEGFRRQHEREILFHQYVQWLIDIQHAEIGELAAQLGMPVGLYQDLAIGSAGDGFDAWIAGDVMAQDIDVGAPPDDFNTKGQNWGFPPFDPDKMRKSGYAFLIQVLRRNMEHAGALRIDHALGMFRLFWIPQGSSPENGAYVRYPAEEILRIIALESVRNKTLVIAEDLGTVGENVRETLFRFRMFSYKLLYFERNYPDPSFKLPERYADLALCAVTTHDLPTLYGYWSGRDIESKTSLMLYPNDDMRQRQIWERQRDKGLLLKALKSLGLLPEDFPVDPAAVQMMIPSLCMTIYEYLSLTPCKLLAVSLDDIIGTEDQQNMPGTIDAYPNWLQKTPVTLEEIMSNRSFDALSKIFARNHR